MILRVPGDFRLWTKKPAESVWRCGFLWPGDWPTRRLHRFSSTFAPHWSNRLPSVPRNYTGDGNLFEIEVAYALPHRQFLRRLKMPTGSTVREAIVQSRVLSKFPEIDLESVKVGIFSRPVRLGDPPNSGDRVEIYRPLILSPTDARRLRAERQKR